MIRNNIVTYTTTLGGTVLVLMGLFGFCFPDVLGFHFSFGMNLVHLASGVSAFHLGLASTSLATARTFCLGIGVFYSVVGLAGFDVGGLSKPLVDVLAGAGFIAAAIM
jgi:hypothetical protein